MILLIFSLIWRVYLNKNLLEWGSVKSGVVRSGAPPLKFLIMDIITHGLQSKNIQKQQTWIVWMFLDWYFLPSFPPKKGQRKSTHLWKRNSSFSTCRISFNPKPIYSIIFSLLSCISSSLHFIIFASVEVNVCNRKKSLSFKFYFW